MANDDITLSIGAKVDTAQVRQSLNAMRQPVEKAASLLSSELGGAAGQASKSIALLSDTLGAFAFGGIGLAGISLGIAGIAAAFSYFTSEAKKAAEAAKLQVQEIDNVRKSAIDAEARLKSLSLSLKLGSSERQATLIEEIDSLEQKRLALDEETRKKMFEMPIEFFREERRVLSENNVIRKKEIEEVISLKQKELSAILEISELEKTGKETARVSKPSGEEPSANKLFDEMIINAEGKNRADLEKRISLKEIEVQAEIDAESAKARASDISAETARRNLEATTFYVDLLSQSLSLSTQNLGQFFFELGSGAENAGQRFKIAMLNSLADVAIAEGTRLILSGVGQLALLSFNPAGAIAAGSALVAAGFGMKLGAGAMSQSLAAGSTGGGHRSSVSPVYQRGNSQQGQQWSGSRQENIYVDKVVIIGNPDAGVGRELRKHLNAADRAGA